MKNAYEMKMHKNSQQNVIYHCKSKGIYQKLESQIKGNEFLSPGKMNTFNINNHGNKSSWKSVSASSIACKYALAIVFKKFIGY